MLGLVPGFHVYFLDAKTWMAGTCPATTTGATKNAAFLVCRAGKLPCSDWV
jgi:hypothetical protein